MKQVIRRSVMPVGTAALLVAAILSMITPAGMRAETAESCLGESRLCYEEVAKSCLFWVFFCSEERTYHYWSK